MQGRRQDGRLNMVDFNGVKMARTSKGLSNGSQAEKRAISYRSHLPRVKRGPMISPVT